MVGIDAHDQAQLRVLLEDFRKCGQKGGCLLMIELWLGAKMD